MTTLEDIAGRLEAIEQKLGAAASPFVRGDKEAATYAGFKSRNAFRTWARDNGIRPEIRGGLNLWRKSQLK